MEVRTYRLPESPMVTTRIKEAVPITIPSAVRAKRTWLRRNESMASNTISRNAMLCVLRTEDETLMITKTRSSLAQEPQGYSQRDQENTSPAPRADALA